MLLAPLPSAGRFAAICICAAILACNGDPEAASAQTRLAPEAWIKKPPSDWPQMVLTNEASFDGHTPLQGGSAFFIRAAHDQVLAVTAKHLLGEGGGVEPPVATKELHKALRSWRVFPRTMPQTAADLGVLDGKGVDLPGCDWLLLKVKTASDQLPAYPLRARPQPVRVGEKVCLVGCPYTEPKAKQNVYVGKVTERKFDRFRYDISPPVRLNGFSGSPILDRHGNVVGVMTVWFEPKMAEDKHLEGGGEDVATIFPQLESQR
jgi:S1-C subfamily serine protease